MAVIPLSRIQRLAVGNRGGREACRREEGVCLLGDGALLLPPRVSLLPLSCGRGVKQRGRGEEPLPETRGGLFPMEKTMELNSGEPSRVL